MFCYLLAVFYLGIELVKLSKTSLGSILKPLGPPAYIFNKAFVEVLGIPRVSLMAFLCYELKKSPMRTPLTSLLTFEKYMMWRMEASENTNQEYLASEVSLRQPFRERRRQRIHCSLDVT